MQHHTTSEQAAGLVLIYAALVAVVAVGLWRPKDNQNSQTMPAAYTYIRQF
jgi:uncharacterized membrane protein (DUF2068 family)